MELIEPTLKKNSTNIAKDKCKGKRKFHFRFDSAEPYPIFYKYRERRKKDKATNFIFIRISSILNDSKYGDVNIGY